MKPLYAFVNTDGCVMKYDLKYVRSSLCICVCVGSIVRELRGVFQLTPRLLGGRHMTENTYEKHGTSIG